MSCEACNKMSTNEFFTKPSDDNMAREREWKRNDRYRMHTFWKVENKTYQFFTIATAAHARRLSFPSTRRIMLSTSEMWNDKVDELEICGIGAVVCRIVNAWQKTVITCTNTYPASNAMDATNLQINYFSFYWFCIWARGNSVVPFVVSTRGSVLPKNMHFSKSMQIKTKKENANPSQRP